jgi:hypothetical protein
MVGWQLQFEFWFNIGRDCKLRFLSEQKSQCKEGKQLGVILHLKMLHINEVESLHFHNGNGSYFFLFYLLTLLCKMGSEK